MRLFDTRRAYWLSDRTGYRVVRTREKVLMSTRTITVFERIILILDAEINQLRDRFHKIECDLTCRQEDWSRDT
jgi:hypothetical protein